MFASPAKPAKTEGASPPPAARFFPCARFRRLRAIASIRRRFGWAIALLPLAFVVLSDFLIRGGRLTELPAKYMVSYAAAMVESGALWALLLLTASTRRGVLRHIAAGLFVLFVTLSVGGQIYFHRQYATYLNLDATLFGTSLSESVFGQLRADGKSFFLSVAPPLFLAVVVVWAGRLLLRPRARVARRSRVLLPAALVAVFLIPCSYRTVQASTPDVIYFHAIGGLVKELTGIRTTAQIRPGLRTPPTLPRITPSAHDVVGRTGSRNVLFVLTESVRFDVACSAPSDDCPTTPETNAAAPDRMPLLQMRSNSSTTAIELAVLWSGLLPTESREALHSAPLLFDYAHAAGIDNAYWTSHHMMFANSRLFVQDLPTSHQCGATDLDPLADIDLGARDELLTARVKHDLVEMKEPFFGVVHYGNTHVPYRVDPADAPFQPALESKSESDNEAYRNHYKNSVHLQDKTIADLIRFVRSSSFGPRTVIVFTSDHGEAFREHGQLGHTGSVYEEEIHVPAWIDAPEGTITASEMDGMVERRDAPSFHTDVTPTILDLMDLWDTPQLATYRASMIGGSLLRTESMAEKPIMLTNCSGIWGCAFQNWGVMAGSRKLSAREWDREWHCHDVLDDPLERNDLGLDACGGLPELARAVYGGLPSR